MGNQTFCYHCFRALEPGSRFCDFCGHSTADEGTEYPHALPCGTILGGRYIVGHVLGQGGFGITYIAQDYQTKERVAIKEFFPDGMVTRGTANSAVPFSNALVSNFEYGKTTFLQEAKTLAQFIGNTNIVGVKSYFEENGTAYFAMEYVEGISLQNYLNQRGGRLPWDEMMAIMVPIMRALQAVHARGIIHRDIKPDNIMIDQNGVVKLLDFGSARYSMGEKSNSLDVVLTHGFAPKEQYSRHGRQGPYTDIYALAATMYYMLTGNKPSDYIDRMDYDSLVPPSAMGVRITYEQEAALLKALAVNPGDSYQDVGSFLQALQARAVSYPVQTPQQRSAPAGDYQGTYSGAYPEAYPGNATIQEGTGTTAAGSPGKRKPAIVAIVALAAALCLVLGMIGVWAIAKHNEQQSGTAGKGEFAAIRNASVGDTVTFGSYEQDNDTSDGQEAIEWLVLAKEDDRVLVISRYGLDTQPYNTEDTGVTWETCSLRSWLNEDFYDDAFTATERSEILQTTVTADANPDYDTDPGNDTEDRVFLLSIDAEEAYFSSDEARMCVPTAYAIAQGALTSDDYEVDGEGTCWWWLRSPAYYPHGAAYVGIDGSVHSYGGTVNYDIVCVRPALWINLGTADEEAEEENTPTSTPTPTPTPKILSEEEIQNASVGDTVTFGSYEQDNDTSDGQEAIEWLVIAKEDDRVLVISRYGLDVQPYNTEKTDVTWETCSLRSWLNEDFYDDGFTESEQAEILQTTVTADANPDYDTDPGNDTEDRVFLLSIDEAEEYFSSDEARMCVPTAYAIAQGAYTSDEYEADGEATCWWWLRSPGFHSYSAADVHYGGPVRYAGDDVSHDRDCVRPALWINLES